MEYTTRNLESDPGMTQGEALLSLQQHPTFKQGSKISGLHKRGNQWVAEVLVPKTAEFPPSGGDDGGEEEAPSKPEPPKSDGADDGAPEGGDGPPSPDDGGGDKKPEGGDKGEPKGEDAMLHILTQILHALTGGGAGGVGGPDALGPGGPGGMAPPPPKAPAGPPGAGAPPAGPGKPPMGKFPPRPMKPGDTPPGGTPIGAPAFSKVNELRRHIASYSGRAATITLSSHDGTDIKQAVAEARPAAEEFGYKVKQAKYDENGHVHILVSRR